MTFTKPEIAKMIRSIGYPCVYHHRADAQSIPPVYIIWDYESRSDFIADMHNYAAISELIIDLYSREKDFDAESRVERVLNRHELAYRQEESYDEDQHMYRQTYRTQFCLLPKRERKKEQDEEESEDDGED